MPGIRELRLSGGGDKIAVPVDKEGHGLIPTESEFGFSQLPALPGEDKVKDQIYHGVPRVQKHGRDDKGDQLYSLFPSPKSTDFPRQRFTATELRQSKMKPPRYSQRPPSPSPDPVSCQILTSFVLSGETPYMPFQRTVTSPMNASWIEINTGLQRSLTLPATQNDASKPTYSCTASGAPVPSENRVANIARRAPPSSTLQSSQPSASRALHSNVGQTRRPLTTIASEPPSPALSTAQARDYGLPSMSRWSTETKDDSGESTTSRRRKSSGERIRLSLGSTAGGNAFTNALRFSRAPLLKPAKNNDLQELTQHLKPRPDSDPLSFIDGSDREGMTALHWAARLGHTEVAQILLERGAKVEPLTRTSRRTPLYLAAQHRHEAATKLLLMKGADPNATSTLDGATALHKASQLGHEPIMEILIAYGADINLKDVEGMSPMFWAMQGKQLIACRVLAQNNADLEARIHLGTNLELSSVEGLNVLLKASSNSLHQFARIFLEAGASPDANGPYGMRPLHRAAMKGDTAMIAVLLEYHADVDAQSKDGWTPLHFATRYGHHRAVQILVRHSSNMATRNNEGQTPADLGAKYGYHDLF